MATKNPIFVDLDRCIFGTFIKDIAGQEPEHVKPVFCPFGLFPKEVTYDIEIPKRCVHRIGGKGSYPGTENNVYYIIGSKRDSDFNVIDAKNIRLIEELKEKIKELELDVGGKQVLIEKAMGSQEQIQTSIKKLEDIKKPKNPFYEGMDFNS